MSVEEGYGFVIVLTRVTSDKKAEFRYLIRRRYLDFIHPRSSAVVPRALELFNPALA